MEIDKPHALPLPTVKVLIRTVLVERLQSYFGCCELFEDGTARWVADFSSSSHALAGKVFVQVSDCNVAARYVPNQLATLLHPLLLQYATQLVNAEVDPYLYRSTSTQGAAA